MLTSAMRRVFLALAALLIAVPGFAQTIDVSGNVTDNTGEPLIGVTVQVANSTIGAATDLDGNYNLKNVPSKGKLIFSYVGYATQTIEVKGQTLINVVMTEDSKVLDDLVVVGYGTMKRSDLTGSVSSVTNADINAKGASGMMENLQGTAPGVNITKSTGRSNGSYAIEIRGKSSINNSVTPIFVVDGIVCNDIDFLNPQDIEKIDVLKDASSTAIYGSRATAGVLMVTTKSGTSVKKGTKASISYDGYYGFNEIARMPEWMDGQQFYNYRFLKFVQPVGGGAQPMYYMPGGSGTGIGQALLQVDNADVNSPYLLKEMLAKNQTYDWPGLVTQGGHQQNHYVAVSGSSETANYHFGVGITDEEGVYKGDGKNMVTFKGSVDAKLNKVISAGFSVNAGYERKTWADDNSISGAYRVNPFSIPYDENGNINHKPAYSGTLGTNGNQFSDFVSPLEGLRNTNDKRNTYRFLGNAYLQLNIIDGLNVKTNFMPTFTYYRGSHFDGYINPASGLTYAGNDPAMAEEKDDYFYNTANVTNHSSLGWTWDNTVNYSKTFNSIHSVNLMGLFSMEKYKAENYYMLKHNVNNDTDWWNMGTGKPSATDDSSSYSENSMISYALRANYSFNSRYMITGTMRWDGSSVLAEGHRWMSFPSLAAAWVISEEDFMQQQWLNNLKLRVAYGMTGNNKGIGNYASIVGIGGPVYYPFGGNYASGYYASGIVDPNLHWEKSKEINLGLDYGFLNNRINGSIEWYTKNSYDLLYKVELPLEAGGVSQTTNIGKVRNTGVEVSLNTVNIDTPSWRWTTTINFAHNNNKVKEINGVSDRIMSSGATGSLIIGMPVNNVYCYETVGIVSDKMMTVPNHEVAINNGFTPGQQVRECDYYYACYGITEGQPMVRDVNGDGKWDAENDRVLHSSTPNFTASLVSNLTYTLPKEGGEIDFSFMFYGSQGGKVYSSFYAGDYYDYHDRGRGKMAMDYYIPAGALIDCDGVNPDGTYVNPVYQTETHYGEFPFPNFGNEDGVGPAHSYWKQSRAITDASFLKVKNITLGYTFSKSLLKHIGCQNARVYFNVLNPFVWSKYKGFDPEYSNASTKNDGPSIRSYQVGVSLKF